MILTRCLLRASPYVSIHFYSADSITDELQTAEHPEDAAALDPQFVVCPQKDDREGIWPLSSFKAEQEQGDAEKDGQADKQIEGVNLKTQKLASGKDNFDSGKTLRNA